MKIAVENVAPCRKRLKIEVPADRVNKELEQVAKDFQKHAKVPGFRQGKVPQEVIEKRFAGQIDDEFKRSFVPQAFREAVQEKKLRVVTQPQVEDLYFQRGMSLSFSAMVDLAPEFPLPKYKEIRVKEPETKEITEKDVQEILDKMVERFAEYKTLEGRDVVQENDFAVMDYTAACDGKPLKEVFEQAPPDLGEKKNFWLWMKPDSFLPGFASQLIGAKAGETKDVEITFADDFEPEALRGKKAVYSVMLRELKERILPELNDELTQKQFQMSVEELRKKVREDLEAQQKQEIERGQRQEIIDSLLKSAKFDLPEALVQRQTQRLVSDIITENQYRGIAVEEIEKNREKILSSASENAKDHVKMRFILGRIAEEEKISVTDQELNIELHVMAHRMNMKPQQLAKEVQKAGAVYEIEEQILHRKTMDFLLKSSTSE